jgi:hypothetical protein
MTNLKYMVTHFATRRTCQLALVGTFFTTIFATTIEAKLLDTRPEWGRSFDVFVMMTFFLILEASFGLMGGLCFGGIGGILEGELVKGVIVGILIGVTAGAVTSGILGPILFIGASLGPPCAEYPENLLRCCTGFWSICWGGI